MLHEPDRDVACFSMAHNVRDSFLENAEYGRGACLLYSQLLCRFVQGVSELGTLLDFLQLPFNSGGQPKAIQDIGTQFSADTAYGLVQGIDGSRNGGEPGAPLGRCRERSTGEPGDVQAHAGERLRQVIVQFPRNISAFLLLSILQMRGQMPELFARTA